MAQVSQTIKIDEAILGKYLSALPRLKTVILGLSYTSFGEDLQQGEETWRLSFYKRHYDLRVKDQADVKDYSNLVRYTPYESLKMAAKNFKVDLVNGMQPNGWMKVPGSDSLKLTPEWAKRRALMHLLSLDKKNIAANMQSLRKIISMLNERHIQVKIIIPPVSTDYYNELDKSWLERNDSLINVINTEFKLQIVDFAKPADSIQNRFLNEFNDADHLNESGASHLARLMSGE